MAYGRFFSVTCPHHFTKILAGLYQVRKTADKPGLSLTQQKVLSLRLRPAMHILFVKSKAFCYLQRKKKTKRISKFCSWLDCIENLFLRVNSFSCPSLHNFLSCSKSGFGIFFPSREGGGSGRGVVNKTSVVFPGAAKVDKLLAVGRQCGAPVYSLPCVCHLA